ncbi:MAG: aminoacyl-tRNA hydrolase [Elusimicrobia bacterium]|nr:aminoacyl-tRNA hydrolase [Elusimicrobiota bacterium]
MSRLIITGLGNPGADYALTRHNLGFMLLDLMVGPENFIRNNRPPLLSAELPGFTALKPMTFMNRSGEAVKYMLKKKSLEPEAMMVVCDDYNLPLGEIRLRKKGSAGGHNGLKSIINHIETEDFPRLRIGIGGEHILDKTAYVLGRFGKKELEVVTDTLIGAKNLIECYIEMGIEEAMNRYN